MKLLGVDTGGTFTDLVVVHEDGSLQVHKVLSTPEAPEAAILRGVDELGLKTGELRMTHGSTVATNAVLEGKTARTAYITSPGMGDVLSIGRQARRELYNLQPPPVRPPVPPDYCLEVPARRAADGTVLESLDEAALKTLRRRLEALAPEAVAINLLYAFVDDSDEKRIAAIVPEGIFVSRASEVMPEYGEYERGITTWLNAGVGPLLAGYLQRLCAGVSPAPVSVMQSSGETVAAAQASRRGVHMLLSGPAGGLAGAAYLGELAGHQRLLSFDMGGTSTDVALIDGEPVLTTEGHIGDYPLCVPGVDMHTIGAGGGSLAQVDAGGALQVGPASAGASPGPACYGAGGGQATVTDANLVLGRLLPDAFLGGRMRLDVAAARKVLTQLGDALGVSAEAAAEGVVRVANEHMARALRVMSVQRGLDPREFVLCCFGGAGGLHVCALAESLSIRRALVPVHAGVLSALGMLAAPRGRQLSQTLSRPLSSLDDARIERAFEPLEARGRAELHEEGVSDDEIVVETMLDLRYSGQSHAFTLPWRGIEASSEAFEAAHENRYGHRLEQPVELVNVRVGLRGPRPRPALARLDAGRARAEAPRVTVTAEGRRVPVWPREILVAGQEIAGPALLTETVSTTWVAPGWRLRVDDWGNLHLESMTNSV